MKLRAANFLEIEGCPPSQALKSTQEALHGALSCPRLNGSRDRKLRDEHQQIFRQNISQRVFKKGRLIPALEHCGHHRRKTSAKVKRGLQKRDDQDCRKLSQDCWTLS